MTLDNWLSEQLASLHTALDDVLDLDRGLVDATLPRVHSDLVTRLDDVLDLDAGLARAVSGPVESALHPVERLAALADELTALPAVGRLAARVWLPMKLLSDARYLTAYVLRVRSLANSLNNPRTFDAVRETALAETESVIGDLGLGDPRSTSLRSLAVDLAQTLRQASTNAHSAAWGQAHNLADSFGYQLAALLMEVSRRTRGTPLAERFSAGFLYSGTSRISSENRAGASFDTALLGLLDRMLAAVTSMVGADLASADLAGLPLNGVLWSSDTRWPPGWQQWVRNNSIPVSADVFEIRQGSTGTSSRVPT